MQRRDRNRINELHKHIEEAEQRARLFEGRRKRAQTISRWIMNVFYEICYKWEAADLKATLRRLDGKRK